jgi:hypothetical protein
VETVFYGLCDHTQKNNCEPGPQKYFMSFFRMRSNSITRPTRRNFLRGLMAAVATSGIFPVFNYTAAHADTASPDAASIEIAALGKRIRELEPKTAVRLDKLARGTAGLKARDSVDWAIADKARLKLTERSRVAAEFIREEVVFVDGWLLANSEAATALLYAAASAPSGHQNQTQVVK